MSERLSDEDLAYFRRDMSAMDGEHIDMLLDEVIALRAEREDCYVAASEPAWGGPLEASAVAAIRKTLPTTGALMRRAMSEIRTMTAELKERRAADLTKFSADAVAVCNDDGKVRRVYLSGSEMEALGTLFAFVYREVAMTQAECDALKPGLDVLSKLTKAGR